MPKVSSSSLESTYLSTKLKPATNNLFGDLKMMVDNADISVNGRNCGVCLTEMAKYSCPRCFLTYCSLPCFKTHGEQCTELFYKDQVEEALSTQKAKQDGSMEEILQRVQDEEKENEEIERRNDLVDQLKKLALNDKIMEDDLGPEIQGEFLKSLKSGAMRKYVEPWTPWWMKAVCDSRPSLPNSVKKFSDLSKSAPSETLPFILSSFLLGYCCTLVCYNGDCTFDEQGVLLMFLNLTPSLTEKQVPVNFYFALEQFIHARIRHRQTLNLESLDPDIIVQSVFRIFRKDHSMMIRCLQHLRNLLKSQRRKGVTQLLDLRLSFLAKRLSYFQSWLSSEVDPSLPQLWATEMEVQYERYKTRQNEHGEEIKIRERMI